MIKPPNPFTQATKQASNTVHKVSTGLHNATATAANTLAATPTPAYRTALLNAIHAAHDQWRQLATLQNIQIMGITAFGGPGCLQGPDLRPLITSSPFLAVQYNALHDLSNAVADGVSRCFSDWQNNVMLPSLPWYPTFAAVPAPIAPPTPNIPYPLGTLVSPGMPSLVNAYQLNQFMLNALPATHKTAANETFLTGIAAQLSLHFSRWLSTQLVTNVMGTGPVPTFAPPFVPVGPVVGGHTIPAPGSFNAGTLPQII